MSATHKTTLIGVIALALALGSAAAAASPQAKPQAQPAAQAAKAPLTVAEATDYAATSRYADVMAFIREIQKRSPYLRVETLCRSAEGRDVPLVIIGNPLPASPLDARTEKKAVIYIQANIHAGEVEGKEASLMMIRDILLQAKPPYLDKLVLLVAPIFNADGNEKIAPNNRRQQPGPAQGVGRPDERPEPRPQPRLDEGREPRGRRASWPTSSTAGTRSCSSTATPRTAPGTSRPSPTPGRSARTATPPSSSSSARR